MTCCHCEAADEQFSAALAKRDLERYLKRGPDRTTRILLDAIRESGVENPTLLDVGGGIGVVHHELLDDVATFATNVDASAAYLEGARGESEKRGHEGRVRFLKGDFVELADELSAADLVTLDRVICCYPDVERLVEASIGKTRRLWVASYPRDRWYVRLMFAVENGVRRLRGNDFRTYVHPTARIEKLAAAAGLTVSFWRETPVWRIVCFSRNGSPTSAGSG